MAYFSNLEKCGIVFLLFIVVFLLKCVIKLVYTYVIGPAVNKVDFKSKGKWALVTGSTDGIGKAYARELASRGCDIVLVSRSLDKLKSTAVEIENEFKVNTKIVQADFCEGESVYDNISKEIADIEIGTIVNNVGVSYTYPEYFLDIPDWEQSINNMIKANIVSTTRMTGLVLPGMVQRGKGVVINIGSGASSIPSPLLTIYAATKAFVEKFTEGLEMEYSKTGIIIQCVLPGFVCSKLSGLHRSSLMAPTAKAYVKSAISLVGTSSRTAGYFPHAMFFYFINSFYAMASKFSVWLVTRSMETTRRKALKKKEKMEA
ncbi:very-long-chain 3-oxoacyl-CoA reductase-B [Bicyclus anynana]|uniref:Very-long-chain 3-oxoacyl-CoA reductase-B n=1 Tax=Bicyclus anynana TaxID=110368 RepID=A0ABM3LIY4_BICAN|nr:very-long-chain 3-oxoacyl-CoA reductase-B [Bicyclus anynana]